MYEQDIGSHSRSRHHFSGKHRISDSRCAALVPHTHHHSAFVLTDYPCTIPNFGLHPWFVADRSPNWFQVLRQFFEAAPSAVAATTKPGACFSPVGESALTRPQPPPSSPAPKTHPVSPFSGFSGCVFSIFAVFRGAKFLSWFLCILPYSVYKLKPSVIPCRREVSFLT